MLVRSGGMSFFFNDTATAEIYTLSLHDALPIFSVCTCRSWRDTSAAVAPSACSFCASIATRISRVTPPTRLTAPTPLRSEEHTSELQSRQYLVCRLLLEKKNQTYRTVYYHTLPS